MSSPPMTLTVLYIALAFIFVGACMVVFAIGMATDPERHTEAPPTFAARGTSSPRVDGSLIRERRHQGDADTSPETDQRLDSSAQLAGAARYYPETLP